MASTVSERVVVVGVDDSAHSYHALETALDLFFIPFKSNPQFKLVVIHARPTATSVIAVAGPGAVDIIPIVEQDLNNTAELVKKKCAEVCSAKSVEIASSEVIEGDPRNIMLEAAERHHASVLVLGSHGYGAVKRVFLGSVSDYLAHHAHCSVMIVKKPKKKNCSVEEIRKAYRKLSLKVHPDKNKAPGSEEAFKKVSKAFTCLSDGNSRSQYDQVGFVDEVDHIQRHSNRGRPRRRYHTRHEFFDDEFDPDEIFRAFFGQQRDMFRGSHAYRTRQARDQHREEEPNVAVPSCLTIIQIIPFLLLLVLAYLPFYEPDYSLHKNQSYQIPKTTENMKISFYVRSSSAFDEKFPLGSSARGNLEGNVIKDYRNFLFQSCRIELQKRRWNKKLPTPHCNELHDRGFVDR
ncbi:unnamed protein product [Thlaspi arvense]|uniref:J domain-containing protein n=1 Tax=Thlaspi arvense TaxID=13288 RepID=A0AAU9RLP4_THLAR|nr:unnamed protein product [Thlaspi arvense]